MGTPDAVRDVRVLHNPCIAAEHASLRWVFRNRTGQVAPRGDAHEHPRLRRISGDLRAVSKREAGEVCLRPDSQAVLDTVLARSSDEIRARFAEDPRRVRRRTTSHSVDSRKFLPVFIGVERARRLRAAAMATTSADDWLESRSSARS